MQESVKEMFIQPEEINKADKLNTNRIFEDDIVVSLFRARFILNFQCFIYTPFTCSKGVTVHFTLTVLLTPK